ncbi:hypothetical protein AK88_02323 [Plasmodium fragile]|uniref:Uncharacterized protein n=1 Tax=Plasmodium fragile TaxID=5857 RepID=A0A0D9QM70_PLAFR|nr:uncharacterized protein AK88_02323 [Plasmodium fragile]KJP88048.1 hypothetical protein AK88_02323 [Plasmodium fragile]
MNQVSTKSKLKTTEFNGGESRGVKFMNRAKGHLNPVSKNVANAPSAANTQFTNKTSFAKNSHLKLRTNNPMLKQPPKSSLKSNQRSSLRVSHVEFAKHGNKKGHHNGDDKGDGYDDDNAGANDVRDGVHDGVHDDVHGDGEREARWARRKVPSPNAANATNAEGKKSYVNKFAVRNHRRDKYGESGKTTTISSGNNNNENNNHKSGNPKLGHPRILSQPQHYEGEEAVGGENEWGRRAEGAIYSYTSPMKRKYDAMENVYREGKGSDNDSNSGGGPHSEREHDHERERERGRRDTNTQSKRYASRGYPHESGNSHYGNNLSAVNNISSGTNEKVSAYGSMMFYSNEKLLGSNNTGLGAAHPSLNSSGLHTMSQEDGFLSRSYQPLSTTGGNAAGSTSGAANMPGVDQGEDNVKTTPLGRSYAKFDRLRRGEPMLAVPAHKYQQQSQQQQQQEGQHLNNSLYYLSKNNPLRSQRRSRHTNYITDTSSERMVNNTMGSHNELFNSCTLDRLSEQNFNSCSKKRSDGRMDSTQVGAIDGGGGEGSVYNGADRCMDRGASANRNTTSNGSHKFSRLLRNDAMGGLSSDKGGLKSNQLESNNMELRNVATSVQYSEGRPFAVGSTSGMGPVSRALKGAAPNEVRNGRGASLTALSRLDSKEGDSEDDYYRSVVHNITNCNSEENDMNALYTNVVNLNNYILNLENENHNLNEIVKTNNSISETVRSIQQNVLTRKKVIQDRRNVINEEYEVISQKLKECESIFCDSNDGATGEKKLKVFYEIDEKKNTLKGKYEMKKMLLKKAEYKIEKLQEYTDAVKLKTLAISERYKKTFLLIEELFRLKIIKDTENEVQVCLIPKNTKTNMWHKLQLDKREMTSDACDYLWSQIESFVDKEALNSYL